jgi:hypothetical protein
MGTVLSFELNFVLGDFTRIRDVAGVQAQHACDPIACLSGVHFLTVVTIHDVATLKG